ncbi:MAG: hypothetical protein M3Y08_14215 [Fibrobacterota bacterium]|nr:hypothetical protein [Fibrobacterota bacterium]
MAPGGSPEPALLKNGDSLLTRENLKLMVQEGRKFEEAEGGQGTGRKVG